MRHLILSSLMLFSGCSLIRVSGLPFGLEQEERKPAPATTAAAAPVATPKPKPKPPEPLRFTVPAEGLVARVPRLPSDECKNREFMFAELAVVDLAEPVAEWTLVATSDGLVKPVLVKDGEALESCPKPETDKVSAPAGRYHVVAVWRAGSDAADKQQTFAFFPGKPNPQLHAEVPAEVPVAKVQQQADAVRPRLTAMFSAP